MNYVNTKCFNKPVYVYQLKEPYVMADQLDGIDLTPGTAVMLPCNILNYYKDSDLIKIERFYKNSKYDLSNKSYGNLWSVLENRYSKNYAYNLTKVNDGLYISIGKLKELISKEKVVKAFNKGFGYDVYYFSSKQCTKTI